MNTQLNDLNQLNFRYLLNTRKYLLFNIGLALGVVVLLFFVAWPQIQASMDTYNKWQQQKTVVERLQKKNQQLQQFSDSDLIKKSDQINALLESRKPLIELLSSLNLVANQSQVQFEEILLSPGKIASDEASVSSGSDTTRQPTKTETKKSNKPYESIDIQLTIGGGLENINNFLKGIEETAPLSTVTKMNLTEKKLHTLTTSQGDISVAPELLPEGPQFSTELLITTYFFSQPISVTVSSALPILTPQHTQILQQLSSFIYPEYSLPDTILNGGTEDLFGITNQGLLSIPGQSSSL